MHFMLRTLSGEAIVQRVEVIVWTWLRGPYEEAFFICLLYFLRPFFGEFIRTEAFLFITALLDDLLSSVFLNFLINI